MGYKSTSCAMIAKEAGVNVALISYYFNNKLNLGLEVCNQLMTDIRTTVRDRIITAGYDYEQIIGISVESRVCNKIQLTNKNFDKFIKELCSENGLLFSEYYVHMNVENLEKKYRIHFNETDEKIAHYCILSIANGLNLVIDKGYIDKDEFTVEKSIDIILKVLDFKKKERDFIIDKSLTIFNKIDISMSNDFTVI